VVLRFLQVRERTEAITTARPKRNANGQGKHDRIIEEIARTKIDPDRYLVQTNLGRSGEHRVVDINIGQQMFPDVIVRDRKSGQIQTLYEVETGESVNDNEAQEEWKLFGSLDCKFILIVPIDRVEEVCRLIDKYHIDVDRLEAYEVNCEGRINLDVLGPSEEAI